VIPGSDGRRPKTPPLAFFALSWAYESPQAGAARRAALLPDIPRRVAILVGVATSQLALAMPPNAASSWWWSSRGRVGIFVLYDDRLTRLVLRPLIDDGDRRPVADATSPPRA